MMSGSNQHHLPKFLLRGFRIPKGTRSKSKVWVYEKNKHPEARSVKQVAAEMHFYSVASADGSPTLDDAITDYELVVAPKYHALRAMSFGEAVCPDIAAEIVTHLTIRGAHLRDTMTSFMKSILASGADIVSDEKKIRPFLGIDSVSPSEKFREAFDEKIEKHAAAQSVGIPKEVLYRMSFMLVKEQFNRTFFESVPLISMALLSASD